MREQWIRPSKASIIGSLISLTFILSALSAPAADKPTQIVDEAERSAQATTLYLDCQAIPSWDKVNDIDRLQASWNSSFNIVKRYLSENNGDRAGRALQIEASITRGMYSTQATAQQVVAVLQSSELVVSIDSGAALSLDTTPPKLVVDTALIRYACDYLLPTESFDELRQSAREISAGRGVGATDRIDLLRTKATKLANAFLIQSIRYESLKLFVLAHEATHISIDRFSPDLLQAKGYQGGQTDCVTVMYLETRADIVGESAVRNLPISTISDEVGDHPTRYSERDLASLDKLAIVAAYKDQLSIIEKTKEWLNYSGCEFSPVQRRDTLDRAFALEAAKKQIPK